MSLKSFCLNLRANSYSSWYLLCHILSSLSKLFTVKKYVPIFYIFSNRYKGKMTS